MTNAIRFASVFLLGALFSFAQTVTPNTTLCAAVTATATSVCLTSTTGVVNQTGLYIDNEYLLVLLSNSQVLAASNAIVPVSRNNRFSGSGPTAHSNSAVVFVALTPGSAIVPGSNGFASGTTLRDVGPCVRGSFIYLPIVYPDLNVIRDCQNSVWTDFNEGLGQKRSPIPLSLIAANGALGVGTGRYVITKAGVAAMTLAAPTAGLQDGTVIVITSSTANAHTVTATGLFQDGSTTVNVATFAANAGASLTIMAYNGKWVVISQNQITFS